MGFSEVFNLFVQIIGRWVSLLMSGLSLDSGYTVGQFIIAVSLIGLIISVIFRAVRVTASRFAGGSRKEASG